MILKLHYLHLHEFSKYRNPQNNVDVDNVDETKNNFMPPYQDHLGNYQSKNSWESIIRVFSTLISLKVRPKIYPEQEPSYFQNRPPKKYIVLELHYLHLHEFSKNRNPQNNVDVDNVDETKNNFMPP